MLSLMGLYVATYLNCQDINKPTEPLTTVIEGREINRKDIEVEKYITKCFKEDEEWIDVVATYYTNSYSDCSKNDGIGANNIRLSRGHIAAPKEYKFGTKFVFEDKGNYEVYEVQDRGGVIRKLNNHTIKVDIYIPNASAKYINQLGVKHFKAKVIK